ncbi:MAG: hypothetical protein KF860_17610, partial [Cyclobacteriaceae bacterium]|nr:hypothetical protein [Cyclobacteriaceae bacterium]
SFMGKTQYLGDVSFAVGNYANKPYYKLYKESKNPIRSDMGLSYPGTTMPDRVDPRISAAMRNIRKDLKENPVENGEQLNLSGVSAGSVLMAQAALGLANEGQKIDNLILIGSPISTDSDLYKELTSNSNIRRVLLIDVVGDNIAGIADKGAKEKVIAGINVSTTKNHPHLQFSDDPETRRLLAYVLQALGIK